MKIEPQQNDAPEFTLLVEQAVLGIIREFAPSALILIKIDNWFGSRWLGFSGKILGAAGVWHSLPNRPAAGIRIPPFVPARVVSQRRFVAPDFDERSVDTPLHKMMASRLALKRKAALELPQTALVWFSGNSLQNDRGSLMAYIPMESGYWTWYVSLKGSESAWIPHEIWGIKGEELDWLRNHCADLVPVG